MESLNHILVIGSYNIDLVTSVSKLPKPGETVLGHQFHKGPGGKGSNQAIAAARLGGNVSFMGCIGDDMFGKEATQLLSSEKININNILVDHNHPTGTALILVGESGENQIAVTPGANYQLLPNHIEEKLDMNQFSWLVLQLEIPYESVKKAVELANKFGVHIILNPAPVIKDVIELLPCIDVFTPNETEAELITGVSIKSIADAEKASKHLLKIGANKVVITMGSKGVYIAYTDQDSFVGDHIPAEKVEAVDTTGAGDCFNGALAVALAEGNSLYDAAKFAIKAAALSVQKFGAGESMPYRSEII